MELITPGFGLVFWTMITFLILLLILRKFAWKPILDSVSQREEGIKEHWFQLNRQKRRCKTPSKQRAIVKRGQSRARCYDERSS